MPEILIPRLQDRIWIDCIKQVVEKFEINFTVAIYSLLENNFSLNTSNWNNDNRLENIMKLESYIIYKIDFKVLSTSFTFYRGGEKNPKSAFIDEIVIKKDGNGGNADQCLEIVAYLMKHLRSVDLAEKFVEGTISREQSELLTIHDGILTRLESLNEKLAQDTLKIRSEIRDQVKEEKEILRKEFQDQKTQIEEKFSEKESELARQRSELEQQRKELDDKSNTHARRQIRKDILDEIKKRQTEFKLTDGTNKLRRPIAIAMFGIIATLLVLAGFSAKSFYDAIETSKSELVWIAGIKQILYLFAAVGTTLFYIRWQNRWFEQHSIAEFQLKKFELDMERASWIVETSLEWKDAKGTSIPTELLESLSKNLFNESGEKAEQLIHPSDQLASAILGSSSMIRLKAGDAELEIDPKKLQNAKIEAKEPDKDL